MNNHNFAKDIRVDNVINSVLKIVIKHLKNYLKNNLNSIVLGGSFGRGEGSYIIDKNNQIRIVNDLDIFIIQNDRNFHDAFLLETEIKSLIQKINIDINIDLTFICIDELYYLKPSQLNYDFKYGSKVVYGDQNILMKIKFPENIKISNLEYKILLNTRLWCYIGAYKILRKKNINENDQYDLLYQLSKSLIAIGESILIEQEMYNSSMYNCKLKELSNFLSRDSCKNIKCDLIIWGFNFKLNPELEDIPSNIENFYFDCLNFYINYYLEKNKSLHFNFNESFLIYRLKSACVQLINLKLDGFKTMAIDYLQIKILKNILNNTKKIVFIENFVIKMLFNYKIISFDNLIDFVSNKRLNGK